jgi:hypothetical protein
MKILRQLLLLGLVVILAGGLWVWWNRPQRVDMAGYVPADSLVYLEANSLPEIISGLEATDGWKTLGPAAGLTNSFVAYSWLFKLAQWTSIGPAETVVLSRAQVGVTVLSLDAAETGQALKIKPRAAIVAETHASEGRTRSVVEHMVGEFAVRAYGNPSVGHQEQEGIYFTSWTAPGQQRSITVAVSGSVAIIGNDESVVRACLAVRRGERPSLANNAQLQEMRRRLGANNALAFGYISPAGGVRLLEVAAPAYAQQFSTDARAESAAATLLPQLAGKVLGGAGWSARFAGGEVDDRYFIALQNGLAARLRDVIPPPVDRSLNAAELLPMDTYSWTNYSYRDPEAAWNGLNAAISAQLPAFGAFVFSAVLRSSLKSYGIENPEEFLRAIGPEIVTARLDDSGQRTLILVQARDERALREFVGKRLNTASPRTEQIGDAVLLSSSDVKRGAASFLSGNLLVGSLEDVRKCLQARSTGKTLDTLQSFRRTQNANAVAVDASAVTYTRNTEGARSFIKTISAEGHATEQPSMNADLDRALDQLTFTTSETRLVEGGLERNTRSAFGQFGALVAQFMP